MRLIAMGFSWVPTLCVVITLVLDNTVSSATDEGFMCPGNYNCSCALAGQGEYELECPSPGDNKISVKFKAGQSALLQCHLSTQAEDYKLLGDVQILQVERLHFRVCPLPDAPFTEVLKLQNAEEIKYLELLSYRLFSNSLERKHFTGLSGIRSLILGNNGLTTLPSDLLMDMPHLQSLDLSNNRVQLSSDLLQPVHGIQRLDVGSNELTTLPPGFFRNLKKLNLLNLWKNKLSNLSPDMFTDLTNLTSLDLSNNGLTTLPTGVFKYLVSLKNLSLVGNNFQTLPADLFRNTLQLEEVQLSDIRNAEMKLPDGLFANLTSLKVVSLFKSGLKELPEDLFWGTTALVSISLQNNKLKTLPQRIFRDLKNLQQLQLANNQLSTLPDNIFSKLRKLKGLDMSYNKINNISKDTFNGLEEIEDLNLHNNSLQNIHISAFQPMKMLRKVRLSNNQLSFKDGPSDAFGPYSPLKPCTKLEMIDLSNNSIPDIFADWRVSMISLRMLNLSHNKLQSLQFPGMSFTANCKVDVRYNNISLVSLEDAEDWARSQPLHSRNGKNQEWLLDGNPLRCDCFNYELLRYFERLLAPELQQMITLTAQDLRCVGPQSVHNQRVLNVTSRAVTCSLQDLGENACMHPCTCPDACSCLFRRADKALLIDCIGRNLTAAPEAIPEVQYKYSNHTELYLTHNRLRSLPDFTLPGYKKVTKFFAGFNNISALNLTSLPKATQVLELDHNNLSYIDPTAVEVISNLTNLTQISLENNPWECNCEAQPLLQFIQGSYKKIPKLEQVKCTNGQLLSELTASGLCSLSGGVVWPLVAVILLLGLLVSVLAALYYRYKREVKVWLFTHRMCLWFVTEEELDKDKLYDAFISYSHKDEEFVVNELVPKLEGGPTPFKLCLHYRDWVAGEWIPNQIARSVEDSRRTVVILSPNFLESVWGRMEFRAAHSQALKEGRARVIVVLYGDIGPTEDLDPELRAYLNMNTYVKWGDPWFYDKLRYALPHPAELVRGGMGMGLVNRSSRNMKDKSLDDKMELICEPNTQAPIISTPAADDVADPLSKNKINGTAPSPQKVPLPIQETNGTAAAVG